MYKCDIIEKEPAIKIGNVVGDMLIFEYDDCYYHLRDIGMIDFDAGGRIRFYVQDDKALDIEQNANGEYTATRFKL